MTKFVSGKSFWNFIELKCFLNFVKISILESTFCWAKNWSKTWSNIFFQNNILRQNIFWNFYQVMFQFFWKKDFSEFFDPNLCRKCAKTGFPNKKIYFKKYFLETFWIHFLSDRICFQKNIQNFLKKQFQKFFGKMKLTFMGKKIFLKLF